jgi:tryptophanase
MLSTQQLLLLLLLFLLCSGKKETLANVGGLLCCDNDARHDTAQ